jgi:GntR family transcriptional regulator
MRRRGRTPSSLVVQRRRRPATADERERLRAEDVVVLRRVRLADGEPLALETAVFPAHVAPMLEEAHLETGSLFATLADAGLVPTAGRASLAAEAATAEDARLLGVKRGAPLLVERRLIHDQAGAPLEWTESRYAGARYGLDVDFDVELPT